MKMKMLLLFSAVTLLVGPAVVSARHLHEPTAHHKLNWIYDLAEDCIQSHTEDFFVEDVTDLAEGRNKCGDKFFCKVHDILHDNKNNSCGQTAVELVRYLNMYNNGRNCAKTLKGMNSTGVSIPVSTLLEKVQHCVRHRNLSGSKK